MWDVSLSARGETDSPTMVELVAAAASALVAEFLSGQELLDTRTL